MLSQGGLQAGAVEGRERRDAIRGEAGVDQGHQAGDVGRVEDHDHELGIGAVRLDVPAELGGDLGVALQQVLAGHSLFSGRTSRSDDVGSPGQGFSDV